LKYIVSIGYEFETHDLAKLSLHQNGKTLINAKTTLRSLKYDLRDMIALEFDDNYVMFGMDKKAKTFNLSSKRHLSIESFLDEEDENEEQEEQEEQEEEEEDNGENQFLEFIHDSDKKNIGFDITNDTAHIPFHDLYNNKCQKMHFKDKSGKVFTIDFHNIDNCLLSGVEYINTYFKPKKCENIIINTYTDACRRILEHIQMLETIKGTLFITNKNGINKKIGVLPYRNLYHKPATNLYYLETSDDKYSMKHKSLMNTDIQPQMTFGCKAEYLIDIMKSILNIGNYNNKTRRLNGIKNHLDEILLVESYVDDMMNQYSKNHRHLVSNNNTKRLKTYLFMILYKLFIYITEYSKLYEPGEDNNENYFKNYFSFQSRHDNFTFYTLIIKWFQKAFKMKKEKAIEQIKLLISTSSVLSKLYKKKNIQSYIETLDHEDKNYGNPTISIISYFDHFEKPIKKDNENDWLNAMDIDSVSSRMEIKNDILLTENRLFFSEIMSYISNETDIKINTQNMTLNIMDKFVNTMYKNNKVTQYKPELKKYVTRKIQTNKNKKTRKNK
jgi:hypothetical protein